MTNEIMMDFPETWEEFEQQYGIYDDVYTNGSRLIQSFRVKQWLDHLSVPEREKTMKLSEVYKLLGGDMRGE